MARDNWRWRNHPEESRRDHMYLMGIKRTEIAIRKRTRKGETAKTSKALAKMMDRIYATDYVATYHTMERK
jgi:hypothetical protein